MVSKLKLIQITLFILCFIGCSLTLYAQNIVVKGKVIDLNSGNPLAYANVSLFDQDENLMTGAVTPESGQFELQVQQGKYKLRIQFISFKTQEISITADKAVIELGTIKLAEDVNQLAEVEVSAKRPQMEMKLDKRIFNVGEDLSNIGGSAESILDNLPSVEVDIDGNVSLRGSGNVRILIDGRPSVLSPIW